MLTKVITLAVALSALSLQPARALPLGVDCSYDAVAQQQLTGGRQHFSGIVYGWVVSETPGAAVSIRCYLTVDGVEVPTATTPTGVGTTAAGTASEVTFTATDAQYVELCAEWSEGSESGTLCFVDAGSQIPPQEVLDVINPLVAGVLPLPLPPAVCDLLPTWQPRSSFVTVTTSGDVYVLLVHVFDCS